MRACVYVCVHVCECSNRPRCVKIRCATNSTQHAIFSCPRNMPHARLIAPADSCAVAASDDAVIVWQFRNSYTRQLASGPAAAAAAVAGAAGAAAPQATAGVAFAAASSDNSSSLAAAKLARGGREKMLHIDAPGAPLVPEQYKLAAHTAGSTADPIAAITAWQHLLLVARVSGALLAFSLPSLTLESQHALRCRPQRLLVNCDASRLAVVDLAGVLSVLDLAAATISGGAGLLKGAQLANERKVGWCCTSTCTGGQG